jgi:hypothetical protein
MLFAARTAQRTVSAPLLSADAPADTLLTVTSSDPNVASVSGPVIVPAGTRSVNVTVISGTDGVATLTFAAAGVTRQVVVVVGTPPASSVPNIVAPVVGVEVKQ